MFKPHPQADRRRRSAIALIKYLLAKNRPEALPAHYRELLDVLIWKITEAESPKHKTRFRSERALGVSGNPKLRHDHVYQRARMIARLEKAAWRKIDSVLKNAIGCTITVEEHARLSKFDKEYGWSRYRKAGIVVIDMQTGKRMFWPAT